MAAWLTMALLLAWRPQMLMNPARSRVLVVQSNAAAQQAAKLLGKMGLAAVQDAKPGERPVTKEFVSAVTIRHKRTIGAVEGGAVADYMTLPIDQYAIYDARLMRRLPEEEGGDGDIFELSIPSMRPQPGAFVPQPKLLVRVKPSSESISLESVGASLFGGDTPELPPNVTAEMLAAAKEGLKGSFSLAFNTTLAWTASRQRGSPRNATDLSAKTSVRLSIQLPRPFTRAPRALVTGAIGVIMRFVGGAILPRFTALLEADYGRWCNGTRNLSSGLGSLTLDEDGYIVVPDKVLKTMRAQGAPLPPGSAAGPIDTDAEPTEGGSIGEASKALPAQRPPGDSS